MSKKRELHASMHADKDTELAVARREIERLQDENKRFRTAGEKLQAAINAIDCALLPPEKVAQDTEAVGGPVSNYCVDCNEDAVVERVKARLQELERISQAPLTLLMHIGMWDCRCDRDVGEECEACAARELIRRIRQVLAGSKEEQLRSGDDEEQADTPSKEGE